MGGGGGGGGGRQHLVNISFFFLLLLENVTFGFIFCSIRNEIEKEISNVPGLAHKTLSMHKKGSGRSIKVPHSSLS